MPHERTPGWVAEPQLGSWAEDMGKFVEQDLTKIAAVYCLVVMLLLFSWPPVPAVLLGTALLVLRRYLAGGRYFSEARLDGRTVLGRVAANGIRLGLPPTGGSLSVKRLDLTSLNSVREFVKDFNHTEQSLDVLINNAGVMWRPFEKTEDGFELAFQVNHLAPFLLTILLLDKLKAAPQGRIINVSSMANYFTNGINFANLNGEETFNSSSQYSNTKLMNIAFASELSRRLAHTRVTAHSLHPGCVKTELIAHVATGVVLRRLKWLYLWSTHKTAEQGAQTSVMLAADPAFAHVSGRYYA
ncbi:retinol dehydrogenase 14-like [Pollicipes pollicipes]|uniref:retinol dehydrogenase 14-like n=1 Tax=Pollicipes pollicipes TaxID=41117 RepID=UPI001884C203|nr:retinol dehydrogenase 14-like [Pollicipes pollicipes]